MRIYQAMRVYAYGFFSTQKVQGSKFQPLLIEGKGEIKIHPSVFFGVKSSPFYYSGYSYIEARKKNSYISIGKNTRINNSATIICNNSSIKIGENCLIGTAFQVMDSDFHHLSPSKRFNSQEAVTSKEVVIGDNVFIGNNVTILKGVSVGRNSVISNGSVVVKDIPENVVIGSSTLRILKNL